MAPTVDYGEIEERSFEPAPAGTYPAKFIGAPLSDNEGASGYKYHKGEFVGNGGEGDDFNNKHIWTNWSLSPRALYRFKADMIKLGANPSDFTPGSGIPTEDTIQSVEGTDCMVTLGIEEYLPNDPELDAEGEPMKRKRNTLKAVVALR